MGHHSYLLLWRACAGDLGRLGGRALVGGLWAVGRAVVVVDVFVADVVVVDVAVVVGIRALPWLCSGLMLRWARWSWRVWCKQLHL